MDGYECWVVRLVSHFRAGEFAWANTLFGELVLTLEKDSPGVLAQV